MSETMVERVAKAIARSIPVDAGSRWCDGHGEDFPHEYSEAEQRLVRGIVRAAVEAMQGPTEAMCAAGSDAHGVWGFGSADAAPVFNAMISAALATPGEG